MNINSEEVKRILILRSDNLGDALLTVPLLSAVKKKLPDSELHFLTSDIPAEILSNFNFIDRLHVKKNADDMNKLFGDFQFDMTIHARPVWAEVYTAYSKGVKVRVGTAYRWFSFLFSNKVREHRKDCKFHESVYNFNLIKSMIPDVVYEKNFEIDVPVQYETSLNMKLAETQAENEKKFIIVHPGSRGSARDLPLHKLKEFILKFINENDAVDIFITGTSHEKSLADEISGSLNQSYKKRVINLTGKLNINELAILIKRCEVFISNSTGPIHIAGLLNKKIIGFYPDLAPLKPSRWKPLSDNAVIITPGENSDEMGRIDVNKIMRSIELLLKS